MWPKEPARKCRLVARAMTIIDNSFMWRRRRWQIKRNCSLWTTADGILLLMTAKISQAKPIGPSQSGCGNVVKVSTTTSSVHKRNDERSEPKINTSLNNVWSRSESMENPDSILQAHIRLGNHFCPNADALAIAKHGRMQEMSPSGSSLCILVSTRVGEKWCDDDNRWQANARDSNIENQ